MKVATIVGTRPEIIRLSRVMAALNQHTAHIIIHTGQNYNFPAVLRTVSHKHG